jgi:hypothetical protein
MNRLSQKIFLIYSASLSTLFASFLLTGAASHSNKSFDEIHVHRIFINTTPFRLEAASSSGDVPTATAQDISGHNLQSLD